MVDVVPVLRRFNRSYTQRIGVLSESFLDSGRPLPLARLLWEIGPGGAVVADLRDLLDLDSGYLSRLLRSLEDDELVTTEPDPDDRRRRIARLTGRGLAEWDALDRRSDELAARLVDPLPPRQRAALADALATADRLLRAAAITIELADPTSEAAVAAMSSYFDELDRRFDGGFEVGTALDDAASTLVPPDGALLLAFDDGAVAGCGGLQRVDETTGEIKRMWVDPASRGLGLGRRMLAALEHEARSHGYDRVVLDTNAVLVEAVAMYESAGYAPTERYNENPYAMRWFEKILSQPRGT